jgi:2-iminobutanoate/2-iminopropanoate deaminase
MSTLERRSIEVDGLGHGKLPIPAACRVGPFIATGGVRGVNRESHEMPIEAAEQIGLMFENLRLILEQGGATLQTVLKITIYIKTPELRSLLNPAWVQHFPDASSRPARHVIENERLGGGMLVQCEALAIATDYR